MNCRKVSHLLSAYMDGELPGVEHRQIRDHMSRCDECHREYDELLQTKRMLGALRVKAPREEMQARILHHIAWEEMHREGRRPSVWLQHLLFRTREALTAPNGRLFGAVVLATSLLWTVRVLAIPPTGDRQGAITWAPAPPTISEYVQGLEPSDPNRFVPQLVSDSATSSRQADRTLIPAFRDTFPNRPYTAVDYQPLNFRPMR